MSTANRKAPSIAVVLAFVAMGLSSGLSARATETDDWRTGPYWRGCDGGPPQRPTPPIPPSQIGAGGEPDPYVDLQWGLHRIQAPEAWAYSTGRCVIIAVLDSGVDATHPDLVNKLVPGYDFAVLPPGETTCDEHGTMMSGIAAAATSNGEGIAGVAPDALLMPIVTSCDALTGSLPGSLAEVAMGIRYAVDHDARVISMSIGWDREAIVGDIEVVHEAIDYAWSRGAVLVAASGAFAEPICNEPATYHLVLCVASVDPTDARSITAGQDVVGQKHVSAPSGSLNSLPLQRLAGTHLDRPDVPGTCSQGIVTTTRLADAALPCDYGLPRGYGRGSGTSSAVPFVSGSAALLLSKGLTNKEVVDRIQCTADDLGAPGRDPVYGWGRVNALRAVTNDRNPTEECSQPVASLGLGESAVWNLNWPHSALPQPCPLPTCESTCELSGYCLFVQLVVEEPADVLRIGVEHDAHNALFVDFFSPNGTQILGPVMYGRWATDDWIRDPEPGVWTIRIAPGLHAGNHPETLRMRALLDSDPLVPETPALLLPNLQANPAFEFTFGAPVVPIGAELQEVVEIFVEPRPGPLSCFPEETAVHGGTRCLRFSAGMSNVGGGPLRLVFTPVTEDGEMWTRQDVWYSDHSFYQDGEADSPTAPHLESYDVGAYEFHASHGHLHYVDAQEYRLYAVGADHELTQAGAGMKQGFCLANSGLVRPFSSFENDDPASATQDTSGCRLASGTHGSGLSSGWTTQYGWNLAFSSIDFTGQPDGVYLLRTIVSPNGLLRESDMGDNVGYSLIRVTGNEVVLIERGIGTDPWDPAKIVRRNDRP